MIIIIILLQVLKKLNISAEEKEKVNIALLAAKGASGESFKSEAAGNRSAP